MRKIYARIINFIAFLKVAAMCLSAAYLVFWFWRFFYLPGTDFLVPIFDFGVKILIDNFATTNYFQGSTIEMAYFWGACCFMVTCFILSRIEAFFRFLNRSNTQKVLHKRHVEEVIVNKSIQDEYTQSILKYKFFSFYIRFRVDYLNAIIAQQKIESLEDCLNNSYTIFINSLAKFIAPERIKRYGDGVFVTGSNFYEIDNFVKKVLDAVRAVKVQNSQDAVNTDFLIVGDSQTSQLECEQSYKLLAQIIEMDYFNKAVITPSFKVRFDLYQKRSVFTTDVLGLASLNSSAMENCGELYILKSKPAQV